MNGIKYRAITYAHETATPSIQHTLNTEFPLGKDGLVWLNATTESISFAESVAITIWRAYQSFCAVVVEIDWSVAMPDGTHESFRFTRHDYARLVQPPNDPANKNSRWPAFDTWTTHENKEQQVMPNWVDNSLEVDGPDGAAVAARLLNDTGNVDFNRVIPMPTVLDGSEASTYAEYGLVMLGIPYPRRENKHTLDLLRKLSGATDDEGVQRWLRDQPDAARCEAAGRKAAECIAATGYADWYDWRIDNWGMKWNALESGGGIDASGQASFGFRTAWDPPFPIIAKLSSEFPTSTFVLNYVDERDDRSRYADFKAGAMIDHGTHDYDRGSEIPNWDEVRERLQAYWSRQASSTSVSNGSELAPVRESCEPTANRGPVEHD